MANDSVTFLLQDLDFVINLEKFVLDTTQEIELIVNYEFVITSGKDNRSIPGVVQGIGDLTSGFHKTNRKTFFFYSSSALSPSTASLLTTTANCISKTSTVLSDAQYKLTPLAKNELLWWVNNLRLCNGRLVIKPQAQVLIQRDTSKKGWGLYVEVSEQGVSDPRRNRIYIPISWNF